VSLHNSSQNNVVSGNSFQQNRFEKKRFKIKTWHGSEITDSKPNSLKGYLLKRVIETLLASRLRGEPRFTSPVHVL